ncbi:MAG: DUF1697 domain-containing protein [Rhizobiaceae bacterium]|nr:DUF1697 domain-containing protein [Rhizobiaceae bacterium]
MRNTVYIVLFRGVGGKTQLPVKPLREALIEAGFGKVATYINSGNAILHSTMSRAKTHEMIAEVVGREFGFAKDIHLATRAEWSRVMERNPFPNAVKVPKFLHAVLLAETPRKANVETVESFAANGEGFAVIGKVAYLYTPGGFGTSKLAEKFDKGIGVPNTARNWNTVMKLAEMASKAAGD